MEQLYDKLTNSAQAALKDFCRDYEDRLMSEAYSSAIRNNTGDWEISLRDIIEARAALEKMDRRHNEGNLRRRKLYLMYGYLGFVYALLGLLVFALSSHTFTNVEFASIIFAAMGLFVGTTSLFFYKTGLGRLGMNKNEERSRFVVDLWNKIEDLGRQLMLNGRSEENQYYNVSQLIDYIGNVLADPADREKLKYILQVRNSIAQGSFDGLSPKKVNDAIAMEYEIIEKLNKKMS